MKQVTSKVVPSVCLSEPSCGFCRQENLAELCAVWSGVISIAVYVPMLGGKLVPEAKGPASTSVAEVVSRLAAFHKLMDTQGADSLRYDMPHYDMLCCVAWNLMDTQGAVVLWHDMLCCAMPWTNKVLMP